MQEKTDNFTRVDQSRLSIQVENTEYTGFVKTGQNIIALFCFVLRAVQWLLPRLHKVINT